MNSIMPAIVRIATSADAAAIVRFQILMAKETEDKDLDPAVVALGVKAVLDDGQNGFYLVGEESGKVISSLLITYEWSDWRNRKIWYFQSVFVDHDYRRQGVFSQMYHAVIAQAQANAVQHVRLYVELDNDRAQKVYESLGMQRLPYCMYVAETS